MSDLKLEFYFVSPLEVVKVTKQNMEEVAAWCGGRVATVESRRKPGQIDTYVWVPTPKGTQISWAFPGMFITKRMVVSEKNELKVTYSVFRRDYFERNYFASPNEAVDKTWERAAKEAAKKNNKPKDLITPAVNSLIEAEVNLIMEQDKERETPSSPLTEPREAEKHEEEAEREAMEASGEPTPEEIEAERQSLIQAKIDLGLVEESGTSSPEEIIAMVNGEIKNSINAGALFVPETLVEEQKHSVVPNHLK